MIIFPVHNSSANLVTEFQKRHIIAWEEGRTPPKRPPVHERGRASEGAPQITIWTLLLQKTAMLVALSATHVLCQNQEVLTCVEVLKGHDKVCCTYATRTIWPFNHRQVNCSALFQTPVLFYFNLVIKSQKSFPIVFYYITKLRELFFFLFFNGIILICLYVSNSKI